MKDLLLKFGGLCILVFCLSACSSKNEKVANEIDQLFSSEFKADEPGAAVLVMREGTVIFEKGYGLADINTKEKTLRPCCNIGYMRNLICIFEIK